MSLNWNLSNIPDHATVCYETAQGTPEEMEALVERVLFMGPNWSYTNALYTAAARMSVTTHTLLFALMDVGIGALTPKSVDEAFTRIHMTETVCGAFRQTNNGPVFFTREEVQMHTGLVTNIGEKTKAQFHAHLMKSWRASLARKGQVVA